MLASSSQLIQDQLCDDLLNCSICRDTFITPKVLPCQHTFCEPCLSGYLKAKCGTKKRAPLHITRLSCPICREVHSLPPEGVSGFTSDFKVGKMAELIKCVQEIKAGLGKCDICLQRGTISQSTDFCQSCSLNFCQDCMQHHNENARFEGHSTTRRKALQSDLMCRKHPSSGAQHYCSDCQEQVCTLCALALHQEHSIVECEVIQRQRVESLQKPLQANITLTKKNLRDICRMEHFMTIAHAQSRDCLEETRLKVFAQTEELYAGLVSKLSLQQSEQREALLAMREKCETSLATMESLKEFSEVMLADTKHASYPGLQGTLEEMEMAIKAKPEGIPDSLKMTSQFESNFQLGVGKLVKRNIFQNIPEFEKEGENVLGAPQVQETSSQPVTAGTDSSPSSSQTKVTRLRSKFPFFKMKKKAGKKSKEKDKSYCHFCETSRYCVCQRQGPRPRLKTQTRVSSSDSENAVHSEIWEVKADLRRTMEVEGDRASSPVEPSAPLDDDVFEKPGLSDSDHCTSRVSSQTDKYSDGMAAGRRAEMVLVSTSDPAAAPEVCILEENHDKDGKDEEVGSVPRTSCSGTSPPSASQHFSPFSQSSSSSSGASTPDLGGSRSRSASDARGLQGWRPGSGRRQRNESLPCLLLSELLNHINNGQNTRRSFRL